MNFQDQIMNQVNSDDSLKNSMFGKRLRRVAQLPNSRRERVFARMEDHARATTGFTGKDWSTVKAVDWNKIIQVLMTLLPIILKLLGIAI